MSTWTLEVPISPPSKKEAEVEWTGMVCRVESGGTHVEVRGIEAESQEKAREVAMQAANRFLDQLARECNEAHEIVFDGRSYKIINEGSEMKTGVAQFTASVILVDSVAAHDRVMIEKRDADGNVIAFHDSDKPCKLASLHTEAMSYLRRGMLADHIHERLRNYCLAIENVASWICKRDGVFGGEFKCVQHALATVYGEKQALRNLQVVWAGRLPEKDESLSERVYKQVRCQLAHAKDGEDKRMPYDEEDIKSMREDKDLVERVARDLIEYQLSALK